MSVLPQGTLLGNLELEEVFLDYDGPKLFSARSATGQRYVAVAVDEDDGGRPIFLYLPVSAERYLAIRSGLLSLREALLEPEGSVFVYGHAMSIDGIALTLLEAREIPDDWLPDEDAFLNVPTATQAHFEPAELSHRADGEVRSLLALRLDRPDLMRTEYPLRDLKDLLEDVQEAVHAIAAESENRATTTGAIPEYIVRDSEFSLVDLQAASFVVVVAPTLGDRIVEMPLASAAADRLVGLVAAASEDDTLRDAVSELEQRAFSKFRGLLEDLADTTTSLKLYLANPGEDLREAGITAHQASRGLEVMSEVSTTNRTVYVESGILIGANVRTRAFELHDGVTGKKYAGKVDSKAVPQIDGLQLGEAYRYSARVSVEQTYGSSSSAPRATHRLQMIKRAPDVSAESDT